MPAMLRAFGAPEDFKIHECLRTLRENHGHTQKEVAQLLGVSFQQIQKYESGKNRLPIEKLYILKVFYDVPFERFFETDRPAQLSRHESDAIVDHICKRLKSLSNQPKRSFICKTVEILMQENMT